MKIIIRVLGMLLLVGIVVTGFKVYEMRKDLPEETSTVPGLVPPVVNVEASDNETVNDDKLRAGWSQFVEAGGVYSFAYPSNYELDIEGEGQYVRISLRGATQRGQTEIYDGVLMVFEAIDLEGQDLEEWVDSEIVNLTVDGSMELIDGKRVKMINGQSAFTYGMRGLGESTYYVIGANEGDRAVRVVTLVADPVGVGYQVEVDEVLETVEVR